MKRKGYVSCLISDNIYTKLSEYVNVIKLPAFDSLPNPVSSHADMLVYQYQLNDSLLVHERYYNMNRDLFTDVNVIVTDEFISDVYPHDILLNALNLNGVVYGKVDYISRYIKEEAAEIVDIKQGYARCSVCRVSDTAIITADKNITLNLNVKNADVLLINEGFIRLNGYNYGFIGGASVKMGDKMLFFGDINKHPDCEKIVGFCEKYGVDVLSLSDEVLYDYGSMVIL